MISSIFPNLAFYNIKLPWTTTTYQQRPLFLGSEGGRCVEVWLYTFAITR